MADVTITVNIKGLKEARKAAEDFEESMEDTGEATEEAVSKFEDVDSFSEALENAQDTIDEFNESINDFVLETIDALVGGIPLVGRAVRSLAQTFLFLKDIIVDIISLPIGSVIAAIDQVLQFAGALARSIPVVGDAIGAIIDRIGDLTLALGSLISTLSLLTQGAFIAELSAIPAVFAGIGTALSGLTFTAGQELEKQLTRVTSIVAGTVDNLGQFETAIEDVAASVPESLQVVSNVFRTAVKAGFRDTQVIREFSNTLLELGRISDSTAKGLSDSAVRITKAFNLLEEDPVQSIRELGDDLALLQRQTSADVADIVTSMSRVAGQAEAIGATKEQISALAAAMIDAGGTARRSGTQLRRFFQEMVNILGDLEERQNLAKILGFDNAQVLKRELETNFLDVFRQIIALVGEADSTEELLQELPQFNQVFNSASLQALVRIASRFDQVNQTIPQLTKNMGDLRQQSEEVLGTLDKQLNRFFGQLKLIAGLFGEILLDPMTRFFNDLNERLTFALDEIRELTDFLGEELPGVFSNLADRMGLDDLADLDFEEAGEDFQDLNETLLPEFEKIFGALGDLFLGFLSDVVGPSLFDVIKNTFSSAFVLLEELPLILENVFKRIFNLAIDVIVEPLFSAIKTSFQVLKTRTVPSFAEALSSALDESIDGQTFTTNVRAKLLDTEFGDKGILETFTDLDTFIQPSGGRPVGESFDQSDVRGPVNFLKEFLGEQADLALSNRFGSELGIDSLTDVEQKIIQNTEDASNKLDEFQRNLVNVGEAASVLIERGGDLPADERQQLQQDLVNFFTQSREKIRNAIEVGNFEQATQILNSEMGNFRELLKGTGFTLQTVNGEMQLVEKSLGEVVATAAEANQVDLSNLQFENIPELQSVIERLRDTSIQGEDVLPKIGERIDEFLASESVEEASEDFKQGFVGLLDKALGPEVARKLRDRLLAILKAIRRGPQEQGVRNLGLPTSQSERFQPQDEPDEPEPFQIPEFQVQPDTRRNFAGIVQSIENFNQIGPEAKARLNELFETFTLGNFTGVADRVQSVQRRIEILAEQIFGVSRETLEDLAPVVQKALSRAKEQVRSSLQTIFEGGQGGLRQFQQSFSQVFSSGFADIAQKKFTSELDSEELFADVFETLEAERENFDFSSLTGITPADINRISDMAKELAETTNKSAKEIFNAIDKSLQRARETRGGQILPELDPEGIETVDEDEKLGPFEQQFRQFGRDLQQGFRDAVRSAFDDDVDLEDVANRLGDAITRRFTNALADSIFQQITGKTFEKFGKDFGSIVGKFFGKGLRKAFNNVKKELFDLAQLIIDVVVGSFSSGGGGGGGGSGFFWGGMVKGYQSGGDVAGESGIDNVPAMLTEGEFVVRRSAVTPETKPILEAINRKNFNSGGVVGQIQEKTTGRQSQGQDGNGVTIVNSLSPPDVVARAVQDEPGVVVNPVVSNINQNKQLSDMMGN